MIFRVYLRKPLAILSMILASFTLAVSAQDEKTPPEKGDEKKEEGLPLKATAKVEFTTDEGTWMSLDVSPDGSTIVFDLLGDIYTLPIAGGEAKRIMGGLSFESQPKFSPDGKTIAFLSDRSGAENIWLCDANGSNPKALTTGPNRVYVSSSWTPDGRYVMCSRSDGFAPGSLWIYDKDGGSGIHIGPPETPVPVPGASQLAPSLENKAGAVASPDGKFIYFAARTGLHRYNETFPLWQISRFNRETSERSVLTAASGSAMRPVLSPDGKNLVYATRYETRTALRVRDLETGAEKWLIDNVTRDDQETRATRDTMPGYCFMPDGKSLIVPINGKIQRVDFETGKAAVIPFTAKVEADIAPRVYSQYRIDDAAGFRARLIRWPSASRDGKRLAFGCLNKIWIMDLPSGKPRRLTNSTAGEFMPTWSPDGRSVAYVTWAAEGGQIWASSTDGQSQPVQLTRRAAYYSDPIYSPDGSKIVFSSGTTSDQLYADFTPHVHDLLADWGEHSNPAEISGLPGSAGSDFKWIPASGGDSTLIASAQNAGRPHFTSDPTRIFFYTGQGMSSIRLDGMDRRTHFRVTGVPQGGPTGPPADDVRIAPDGRQAFVDLGSRHYLVSVPQIGKEVVNISITGGPSSVPIKKLSAEGGDYLEWSADGKAVTWSWGAKFYRQDIATDKPEITDVVIDAARHKPAGVIVLSGARIVSMKGNEIIEKGDIVVTDNHITAIGPKGTVKVPQGAKVMDVTGKTIIPGFVDVHAHMWPPRGVNLTSVWQYTANLAYGITTTRDPQSATTDIFNYNDLVETGEILGPRIFTTGPGVGSTAGIDSKETARNVIKRYKEAYKCDTLKEYMTGDRNVRQWVAMACRDFNVTPTTEGGLDMKLDLSQMADGFSGNEHALPIHPIYKDVAQYVAKTGTFYTPTILVAYGAPFTENYYFENTDVHGNQKLRRFIPHELLDTMVKRRQQWFHPEEYGFVGIAKGCMEIVRAGGRVCLGGHGQLQGLGCHWEIWNLQSGGLTPHETLRCATLFGAEAIGLQQDVGSLEVGKFADLLVLDQDPLKDIHNTNTIRFVMKNGEIFEGDTLDQVWPVQKKLGKMYWWDNEPR